MFCGQKNMAWGGAEYLSFDNISSTIIVYLYLY